MDRKRYPIYLHKDWNDKWETGGCAVCLNTDNRLPTRLGYCCTCKGLHHHTLEDNPAPCGRWVCSHCQEEHDGGP